MAMRFDQIGSAQNVQQVGQGEAYVQDKYENPLLGVGKMTASLAQANRKAQIAAAKANQERFDKVAVGAGGAFAAKAIAKKLDQLKLTYSKGNQKEGEEVIGGMAKLNNVATQTSKMQDDINVIENSLNPNDYDVELSSSNLETIKNNVNTGIDNDDYTPLNVNLANARVPIINNENLVKMATAIGQDIDMFYEGDNSIGTGGVKSTETKNANDAKIKATIEAGEKSPLVQNRYSMDMRNDIKNGLLDKKYLTAVDPSSKLDPNAYYVEDDKGVNYLVNKKEYIHDMFTKAINSNLSETNRKRFSQLYVGNKYAKDGLGSDKDFTFTPGNFNYGVTKTNSDGTVLQVSSTSGPNVMFNSTNPKKLLTSVINDESVISVSKPGDNTPQKSRKLNKSDIVKITGISYALVTEKGNSLTSNAYKTNTSGHIDENQTSEAIMKMLESGYRINPNRIGGFITGRVLSDNTKSWVSGVGASAAADDFVSQLGNDTGGDILMTLTDKDRNKNGINAARLIYGPDFEINKTIEQNPDAVAFKRVVKQTYDRWVANGRKITVKKTGANTTGGPAKIKRTYKGLDADGNPIYE